MKKFKKISMIIFMVLLMGFAFYSVYGSLENQFNSIELNSIKFERKVAVATLKVEKNESLLNEKDYMDQQKLILPILQKSDSNVVGIQSVSIKNEYVNFCTVQKNNELKTLALPSDELVNNISSLKDRKNEKEKNYASEKSKLDKEINKLNKKEKKINSSLSLWKKLP